MDLDHNSSKEDKTIQGWLLSGVSMFGEICNQLKCTFILPFWRGSFFLCLLQNKWSERRFPDHYDHFYFHLFELLINCINLRNRLILGHRNATKSCYFYELRFCCFIRLILWYLSCEKSRAEGIGGVGRKCFKVSQLIAFYCFGLIFITSVWLKARFMPVLYIDRIICLLVLKFSILQLAADETWKPEWIYMGF